MTDILKNLVRRVRKVGRHLSGRRDRPVSASTMSDAVPGIAEDHTRQPVASAHTSVPEAQQPTAQEKLPVKGESTLRSNTLIDGPNPNQSSFQMPSGVTADPTTIDGESTSTDNLTEKDSYGIKILHNPVSAFVDIIFVHGLTGNAHKTWLDKDSRVHWPQDLLKLDLEDARIMTFGYDADVANFLTQAAQDGISGYANDLLGGLAGRRENTPDDRKIIFVAHSLGGLVTKKAVALSRESRFPHLRDIEMQTAGIVFLGTPHHGSDLARWGSILTDLVNLTKPANSSIVKLLHRDSEMLAEVNEDFHNVVEKRKEEGNRIALICFYETMPLATSIAAPTLVVPKDSAVISGELQFPIHKNHKDMTKWPKREDKGYQDILREIRMIADNPAFRQFWNILGEINMEAHLTQTAEPLDGTFMWIQERIQLNGNSNDKVQRLVRITGKPGCGKSVLSASMFRRCLKLSREQQQQQQQQQQKEEGSRVTPIFYAFSGHDATRRSPTAMLSSLIRQLFHSKMDRLLLREYFNKNHKSGDLPANVHNQVFRWACSLPRFGRVICIIDALDECDPGNDREELVNDLEALLCQEEKCGTTLILSNRDYWELSLENVDLPEQSVLHINLDQESDVQKDLRAFTVKFVEQLLKKRPAYQPFKERLIDKVFERASNGMFLMVRLVVELLYRSADSSPFGIDRTINTLPLTLQEVYQRIWESIEPSNKPRARQIMGWIIATFQPVAVQTLADALAHEMLLDSDDDEPTLVDARPIDLRGDLKRLFGPLIRVADTVELTHQTVKEFFLLEVDDCEEASSMPLVLSDDRHIKIAITCLFCMTRNYKPEFNDASSVDTILGVDIPPFYPYARRYCQAHMSAAIKRGENEQAIYEFQRMYETANALSRKQEGLSYLTSNDEEEGKRALEDLLTCMRAAVARIGADKRT
ncbi:hypothetical protein QWA68_014728 [Fusarium oxysporum]|nr:hypothetical protein QWA68_014728 [Fusarium oxysporum]